MFDLEKMVNYIQSEIFRFSQLHSTERFYGFAIYMNMLCLNSEEKFQESLKRYQENYPDLCSTKEQVDSLRASVGEWHYQGLESEDPFAELSSVNGFDDECYHRYHDIKLSCVLNLPLNATLSALETCSVNKSDEYERAMIDLINLLKDRDVFSSLKMTDDFLVSFEVMTDEDCEHYYEDHGLYYSEYEDDEVEVEVEEDWEDDDWEQELYDSESAKKHLSNFKNHYIDGLKRTVRGYLGSKDISISYILALTSSARKESAELGIGWSDEALQLLSEELKSYQSIAISLADELENSAILFVINEYLHKKIHNIRSVKMILESISAIHESLDVYEKLTDEFKKMIREVRERAVWHRANKALEKNLINKAIDLLSQDWMLAFQYEPIPLITVPDVTIQAISKVFVTRPDVKLQAKPKIFATRPRPLRKP